MADRSAIEWTDASWNPIRARNKATGKVGWHCEHATTGCEFCYAEGFNRRLGTGLPFKPGHRKDIDMFLDEEMLIQPLRWKKPRNIFVCSMTDLFAEFVPADMIDRMFAVMASAPQHRFQVLTKRANRMRCYIDDAVGRVIATQDRDKDWPGWPLPNVWLGVSTERQQEADERIPVLLATPAAVRFISAEPLLGPIDLTFVEAVTDEARAMGVKLDVLAPPRGLDWVIIGGESGPGARPMHPDWARSLRDQCSAAGVRFFFKQWGEHLPWSQFNGAAIEDNAEQTRFLTHEWDGERWEDVGWPMWCDSVDGNINDEHCVARVGKKRAGRLLDDREHSEFPGDSV